MTVRLRILAAATASLGLAALAGGCYTVHTASSPSLSKLKLSGENGEIVEHVLFENTGWFLFYHIPIVCGNTADDAVLPMSFFSDQVTDDTVWRRMEERAKSLGARAVRTADASIEDVTFDVPGLSFPLVVPYVLCYREAQVSGVLVKDGSPKQAETDR